MEPPSMSDVTIILCACFGMGRNKPKPDFKFLNMHIKDENLQWVLIIKCDPDSILKLHAGSRTYCLP